MREAVCDGCERAFQVADAAKTYRCKHCGGRVAVRPHPEATGAVQAIGDRAADERLPNERCCRECGAIHVDVEIAYCEECGASLDGSMVAPEERARRRSAIAELNKAKESIRAVRTLYWVGALLSGLLLGLLLLAFGSHGVGGTVFFVLGLTALIVGLYVAGAVRIFREPLLWSTLIASLETIQLAMSVIEGAFLSAAIRAVWALALWSVVARVTRVRRLIEKYPELWHAQMIARRRGSSRDKRAPTTARVRRLEAAKGEARRRWMMAGAAAVVLVGLGAAWKVLSRPPLLSDAVSEFVDDWNRSDVAAVTEWFSPDRRDKVAAWINKTTSGRDWSGGLPKIQEHREMAVRETSAAILFATIDGDIQTAWRLGEDGWGITTVKVD